MLVGLQYFPFQEFTFATSSDFLCVTYTMEFPLNSLDSSPWYSPDDHCTTILQRLFPYKTH
jgi:hypothetical protein